MKKRLPMVMWVGLLLVLIHLVLCLILPAEEVVMAVNGWYSPFKDQLFQLWTKFGEGWVMAFLVVLVAVFYRIRVALAILTAFVFSGLGAQFLKRLVFGKTPRPVEYFEIHQIEFDFHRIEGIELRHWYSFPSGHTATAFGVFLGLSLFLKGPWRWLPVILALGVGFSRIYLGMHFLCDVCGGMALGLFAGSLGWWWLKRYRAGWLDYSLAELIKK